MSQFDVLLTQNISLAGVEYQEQFVNVADGSLLTANSSNVPVSLPAGTNGQVLSINTGLDPQLEWINNLAGGYWTDNTTYVSPPASYSVKTIGDNYGFFTHTAYVTGIRSSAGGTDLTIVANGTEVAYADASRGNLVINTKLSIQNGSSPGPILEFGGYVTNKIKTGDSSITGNLHVSTGDADFTTSGHLYLYTGTANTIKGSIYLGTGSAVSVTENASATHVVTINTSTGLLSWTAIVDL